MNPYEFVFKLHDLFTSPLARIANNYERVTGGMQRRAQILSRMFAPVGGAMRRSFTATQGTVAELIKQLDTLKDKARNIDVRFNRRGLIEANRDIQWIEKRIDKLQNLGVSRGRGGGTNWLMRGGMVAGLAYGAMSTVQAATDATIKPAMQRSTTLFQLNELTQNPAFVKGLEKQFAAYAPEKMGELFSASQKLTGAGVQQKDLFGTIKTLNNLSALSNTKVDELAFIQAKIKATGYVQGDEMDMYRERGINLNSQIAKVLGIQENQVKKAQEKGLITYDKFNKALDLFVGKGSVYEKVYERKRDATPEGKYNFMMGQFNEKLTQLGAKALPTVNNVLDYILKNSENLTPLLSPLEKLSTAFNPLFEGFGGILQQMGVLDSQFNISKGFIEQLSDAMGGVASVIEKTSKGIKWEIGLIGSAVDILFADTPLTRFMKGAAKSAMPGMGLVADEMDRLQKVDEAAKVEKFTSPLARKAQGANTVARRMNRNSRYQDDFAEGGIFGRPVNTGNSGGIGKAAGLEASVTGAKSSVVNINIKSFAERFEVNVETLNEGVDNVERQFMEMFTRLLASGASIPD